MIFLLDPLKPHFYYISTGLRGSFFTRRYFHDILPTVSNFFERSLEEQLSKYFENLFNPYLSAFRKGYSCQSVLLSICEEWRSALDRGDHVAAILMDLSKAFDCLPHSLIKDKLTVYGLSKMQLV